KAKIPVVFRGGNGIAHQLGATHSHRMEPIYARVPGLVVVAPSTAADAKALLKSSIRCDDPVIFLESEMMLNIPGDYPDGEHLLPLGVANIERPGSQVTVISYGRPMQRAVRPAVDKLVNDYNIDVELIDLRTLRPLDLPALVASIKKTNRCVIVD